MKFTISFLIWLLLYLPVVLVSIIVVPLMLKLGWEGFNTIFGNATYGRNGNSHLKPPVTLWKSYVFLVFRNPVSNWGKHYLSVSNDSTWAWLKVKEWWHFGIKYGWGLRRPIPSNDSGNPAKFLFRIYWK